MFRITVIFPDEAKEVWKAVKAKASLEGKSIGNWILGLIKEALQKKN